MTTVESKLRKMLMQPIVFAFLFTANIMMGTANDVTDIDMTCETVYRSYPYRIKRLFSALDLDQEELKSVKASVKKQDWGTACEALLHYYRNSTTVNWLRQSLPPPSDATHAEAELILQDVFTFQSVTGRVDRRQNGLLNWTYQGPKHDREWTWFLNRHYHLLDLFRAYQKTGNRSYVRCISNHIVDWVISNPSTNNPSMWAQWRGLEAAYRVLHWAPIFYGLQQVDEFTPVARLMMMSSLVDHAFYLRSSHDWGDNWVAREMRGLATIAIYWQEFKQSRQWLNYASCCLLGSMQQQFYPDGAHKELTNLYHRITLRDLQSFVSLLSISGQSVSSELKNGLEHINNYLAYCLRPDGYCVLNNDSDQEDNRDFLLNAATLYRRPDWIYIATNGVAGQVPLGEPSVVFPWAGQVVMRSAWDAVAHWAFFDVGPLGVNYHIHQDKLHLSIVAYGRDLLVDSGRYRYVRDRYWHYFRSSASHNVILIDGEGQGQDVRQWKSPMTDNYVIKPEFDFAQGVCDRGFKHLKGKVSHTRAVVYLRGNYWVVVDYIETDRPRQIEPLWHFHPDCTVAIHNQSVVSIDAEVGNLGIIPVANFSWQVSLVAGQTQPVQGWWSREYNHCVPNPTAIYSARIASSAIFAWVLFPAKGQVPQLSVAQLPAPPGTMRLHIKLPGKEPDEIAVRMVKSDPVLLSDGLKLEGNCAILRFNMPSLVAQGCLTKIDGTIAAEHRTGPH